MKMSNDCLALQPLVQPQVSDAHSDVAPLEEMLMCCFLAMQDEAPLAYLTSLISIAEAMLAFRLYHKYGHNRDRAAEEHWSNFTTLLQNLQALAMGEYKESSLSKS
jgi:hypothetical protein